MYFMQWKKSHFIYNYCMYTMTVVFILWITQVYVKFTKTYHKNCLQSLKLVNFLKYTDNQTQFKSQVWLNWNSLHMFLIMYSTHINCNNKGTAGVQLYKAPCKQSFEVPYSNYLMIQTLLFILPYHYQSQYTIKYTTKNTHHYTICCKILQVQAVKPLIEKT